MIDDHWDIELLEFDSIDSTNEEARRRVAGGRTGPLWIAARRQTTGRGRRGRAWSTEIGNLAATYLSQIEGSPADAARLSFAASLAVADVVAALAPNGRVEIKWPNDVLLNKKKVSGILLETMGDARNDSVILAIGMGINLVSHPDLDDNAWPSTHVGAVSGDRPGFDFTLSLLVARMEHWMDMALGIGFRPIRLAWLDRAARLGDIIEVKLPNRNLHGRFADLDEDGALVLSTSHGIDRIAAGEVYFPESS